MSSVFSHVIYVLVKVKFRPNGDTEVFDMVLQVYLIVDDL